jgi:D-alanine-D-alanine ligase
MRICIIYNLLNRLRRGKEQEVVADFEAIETAQAMRKALERNGHTVLIVNVCQNGLSALQVFDAIFNLAETTLGSDVTEDAIAQAIEDLGIPFTGSGAQALRRCCDKALAKSMLINAGIPTPNYQIFRDPTAVHTDLVYPLIVKPIHEDGSIGISEDCVVHDACHLEQKVLEIQSVYRQPALVEEFIDGREIHAPVLGNGDKSQVLPLSEVVFSFPAGRPRIVSFAAKWLEDSDAYLNTSDSCPADLEPSIAANICDIALQACRVMGVRDYARLDFRLRDDKPYVLEVNPNPCLNPVGNSFILSARTAGLGYDDVVNAILNQAVARMSVAPARERVEAATL